MRNILASIVTLFLGVAYQRTIQSHQQGYSFSPIERLWEDNKKNKKRKNRLKQYKNIKYKKRKKYRHQHFKYQRTHAQDKRFSNQRSLRRMYRNT